MDEGLEIDEHWTARLGGAIIERVWKNELKDYKLIEAVDIWGVKRFYRLTVENSSPVIKEIK